MTTSERIYIGGLDPPRLTARHVIDRINQTLNVEIRTLEDHEDKSFCHITASLSEATDESSPPSALSLISSKYNNVKWKGCRLVIETARPNFLQRLEEERRQRDKEKIEAEMESKESDAEIPVPVTRKSIIPRRLRIRKKFGDEAYHVDTKPWSVDNWSHFSRAVGKHRKKEEKHRNEIEERTKRKGLYTNKELLSVTPTPFMHRAVHIRFDSAEQTSTVTPIKGGWPQAQKSPAFSSYSDDSSSESGGDDSEITNEAEKSEVASDNEGDLGSPMRAKEAYVWSDESEQEIGEGVEDDSSVPDESETEGSSGEDHSIVSNLSAEMLNTLDASKKSESEIVLEVDADPKWTKAHKMEKDDTKGSAATSKNQTSYQWSSDEESSEDEFWANRSRHQPLVPVTQSDEFAAGLEDPDDEHTDQSNDDMSAGDTGGAQEESRLDLSNDVSANLNILSSILPGVSPSRPAISRPTKEELGDGSDDVKQPQIQNQTGFGSSGIMLRFDPRDTSAQQFEIKDEIENENEKGEELGEDKMSGDELERKSSDNKTDGNSSKTTQNAIVNEAPSKTEEEAFHVYEQDKLENVFRAARKAWDGGPTSAEDSAKSTGEGFSFAFDLGDDLQKGSEQSGSQGFSFGFDLPHQNSTQAQANDESFQNDASQLEAERAPSLSKAPEKRIKGVLVPAESIRRYQSIFFAANDGARVLKNVEGFRNDPQEKEAWLKERQNLTLDWKRKRKHAQSRIQKRMKIR